MTAGASADILAIGEAGRTAMGRSRVATNEVAKLAAAIERRTAVDGVRLSRPCPHSCCLGSRPPRIASLSYTSLPSASSRKARRRCFSRTRRTATIPPCPNSERCFNRTRHSLGTPEEVDDRGGRTSISAPRGRSLEVVACGGHVGARHWGSRRGSGFGEMAEGRLGPLPAQDLACSATERHGAVRMTASSCVTFDAAPNGIGVLFSLQPGTIRNYPAGARIPPKPRTNLPHK